MKLINLLSNLYIISFRKCQFAIGSEHCTISEYCRVKEVQSYRFESYEMTENLILSVLVQDIIRISFLEVMNSIVRKVLEFCKCKLSKGCTIYRFIFRLPIQHNKKHLKLNQETSMPSHVAPFNPLLLLSIFLLIDDSVLVLILPCETFNLKT